MRICPSYGEKILLNKSFEFSIIMPFFNVEDYLKEAIDSIINQTLNFEEYTQLILIDDGSTDNSKSIALDYEKKFPDNIIFLSQKNSGQACARNLGLKYVKGKYVNFLDSDDYLSENTLEEVLYFFERYYDEIDLVAMPMILFGRNNGNHRLNYKFNETRIIDLSKEPDNPQMSSSSTFIKYEAIKDLEFDENLISAEDALLVNKILLEKMKYGVISSAFYYYRQRYVKNSTIDTMTTRKEYFTPRLRFFFKELIDYSIEKCNEVPLFIQYMLVYDLHWMLKISDINIFENKYEEGEFWYYLDYVISFLDDEAILNNRNIEKSIRPFFMFLKNRGYTIDLINSNLFIKSGIRTIDHLNNHKIWIDIIEIREGYLNILGQLSSNFDNNYIKINILKEDLNGNSQKIECKVVKYSHPIRNNVKYLSINWKFCYNFEFNVPIEEVINSKLIIYVDYFENGLNEMFNLDIGFSSFSGLSTSSSYFIKDSIMVLFKNNALLILPYSYTKMLRYEYSNIKKIFVDKEKYFISAMFYRLIFLILYPFLRKKRVWLFEDRPDFADDNAKHLFYYSEKQEDGIKKYFVIGKDSEDYLKLKKKSKNILKFGSMKHKFLFLFAEKNISSYVNENFINPFYGFNKPLYSGLITSEFYFLQHGVTKDDVSYFIKRFDKKLSLIVTVSDLERDSFLKEGYNFHEDIVKTLGFPRYDNLSSNCDKKQILFAPTWRIQFYNEDIFLNSDYYKSLIELLNNEQLSKILNFYGYKLVFKPHPELNKYLESIELGDYVILSEKESYQELFRDSSILITDFSSVYFDFAYLKKPVIYYQPNDDYHYEKGYFDYELMGFGEVINDYPTLLKSIEKYFSKNCLMEEKYKDRVNRFFKYIDKNNCKRVYEWILKH